MSELYITEPPTSGKVILETNYGNIDIELFTLEAPKSCKNFIQHCLNKYYNGCIFFKIFKNFMIQTGDPTNTGNGGSSIYQEDFRDEFHSRLKFNHRGVVAMANKNKPNTNGSQFFITLDKCEDMDKKFTIFGKVTGPTFFNAVNISNLTANEDGCPIMNDEEKPKIINTEVVINPFHELKPTVPIKEGKLKSTEKKKKKKKAKKLKIKYSADKMFLIDDDNEKENINDKEEEEVEKNTDNNINEKEEINEIPKNEDNNINIKEINKDDIIKEQNEENNNDSNENNKENINDKDLIEQNKEIKQDENIKEEKIENKRDLEEENIDKEDNDKNNEEKEESEKTYKINKKINNNENEENEDNEDNEDNENSEEGSENESESLSSDDNEVKNAKQLLDNDDDNAQNNKRKNIEDYKKEINLLRKKVRREKEKQYNEDELRKKVEEEKFNKMNILQKYNYDYIKSNQANKLTNDERANKLKNFKSFIYGGDSTRWYKTKLKFQTDSQKAFTLDMINK